MPDSLSRALYALTISGLITLHTTEESAAGNVITECAAVLRPTRQALIQNKYAQLAQLRTIQSDAANNDTVSVDAKIKDYFHGIYETQSQAESSLNSYDNLSWSTEDYLSYLTTYVPKESYPAYNECVKSVIGQSGIHILVVSADEDNVVINVKFSSDGGAAENYKLSIQFTNTPRSSVELNDVPASGFPGKQYIIRRTDRSKPVFVVANVDGGPTLPPGESIRVPPFVRTQSSSKIENVSAGPSSTECGGSGSAAPTRGSDYGPPTALDGEEYIVSTLDVRIDNLSSWNGNLYLAPPPYFNIVSNTPKLIKVHTVCNPYNDSVRDYVTTSLTVQKKTTTYSTILPLP